MIFNKSLEKIIVSSVEGKSSGGVIFVGPRGVLKLFSSEIILSRYLPNYSSYLPFLHSDIFFVGPYYYRLYYRFFEKNSDFIISDKSFRDVFVRFCCLCLANRKFVDEDKVSSDLLFHINSLKNGNVNYVDKVFKSLDSVVDNISKYESIGIDTVREIIDFVSKTSLSGYKFIIISEFDNATIESQNALLKILEEPPKGVFFILTTSRYDRVLPTVRSRTVRISFFKPKGSELKEFFGDVLKVDDNGYYSVYDLMVDNVYDIENTFFKKVLNLMFSGDLDTVMDFVEEISQEDILVEKFFEVASKIINVILEFRAKVAGLDVQVNKEVINIISREHLKKFSIAKLYRLQKILNDGYRNVYTFNINPSFVITNFFVEVFS